MVNLTIFSSKFSILFAEVSEFVSFLFCFFELMEGWEDWGDGVRLWYVQEVKHKTFNK